MKTKKTCPHKFMGRVFYCINICLELYNIVKLFVFYLGVPNGGSGKKLMQYYNIWGVNNAIYIKHKQEVTVSKYTSCMLRKFCENKAASDS